MTGILSKALTPFLYGTLQNFDSKKLGLKICILYFFILKKQFFYNIKTAVKYFLSMKLFFPYILISRICNYNSFFTKKVIANVTLLLYLQSLFSRQFTDSIKLPVGKLKYFKFLNIFQVHVKLYVCMYIVFIFKIVNKAICRGNWPKMLYFNI